MLYSSLYEWERFYKSTVEESRQLSKSTYGMAITDKDTESADGSIAVSTAKQRVSTFHSITNWCKVPAPCVL
jgi:hypothetical protein